MLYMLFYLIFYYFNLWGSKGVCFQNILSNIVFVKTIYHNRTYIYK